MFKYLINGELFVFSSEEERDDILEQARANEYTIELVEEKEKVASDKDFQKDTTKSADVVSKNAAQNVTGLPFDDGSLAFQNNKPLKGDDLTALGNLEVAEEDLTVENLAVDINEESSAIINEEFKDVPKTDFATKDYTDIDIEEKRLKLNSEFIKNNKEIQEVIIPSIKKEVEELAKTEIFRLKQKYGIDDVSQVTEEKLNEINKEYSDWYNNELNDRFTSNKEIKNLQKAFGINFNKTIGEDYKRFNKVDQSSSVGNFVSRGVLALEDISNSDAYSPVAQVAAQVLASPINLLRQVETSGQKAGINMQGFFNQDKIESLNKNIEFSKKYNWDDKTKGYWIEDKTNNKGNFKFTPKYQKDVGFQGDGTMNKPEGAIEGTWGDFQKIANTKIKEESVQLGKRIIEVREESFKESLLDDNAWEKLKKGEGDFGDFLSVPAKQIAQMGMTYLTLGASSALQIGSDIYSDNIENEGKKRFNLTGPNGEEIPMTVAQYEEIYKDKDFMNKSGAKAVLGGTFAGALDKFGATQSFKLFANLGSESLLRNGFKNFIKGLANAGANTAKTSLTEVATEVMQESIQMAASGGEFAVSQLGDAAGQALLSTAVFGVAGKVRTQTVAEIKAAGRILSGKLNPKSSEAYFNSQLDILSKDASKTKNEAERAEIKEKYDAVKNVRDTNAKIPQELSGDTRQKALDLLIERQEIENSIKDKDPELVKNEKSRILQINSELNDISSIDKASKTAKKILKDVGKGDTNYISLGTKKEVENWLKENTDVNDETAVSQSTSYGFNIKTEGKPDIIIINEEKIFESGKSGRLKNNTSAHEVLHTILNEAIGAEQMAKMGNELASVIKTALGDQYASSEFGMRYAQYEEKFRKGEYSAEQLGQEAFTLLSEALLDNKLNFDRTDQSFISKLKETIKNVYANVIGKPIEFNTTDDLFDFIESYNKSVTSGKGLSRRVKATIEQGAKGAITTKDTSVSSSLSPDVEQRINQAEDLLNEAEDAFNEDPNNPQAEKAFNNATAAYNALLEGEAKIAEDIVEDELVTEIKAEDFIQKKKDPSTKKRSLTSEQRQSVEDKIVKAKALSQNLRTEEKKAIAEKVKEIENISNKEMRRSEQKRLIDLAKNNPVEFAKQQGITVQKPAGLAALEKEIANDLKVPIDKFVNSVGVLFYKMQKPQVRDTIDLNTFLDVVRGDVLSIAINEFNPESTNRQGEKVINNIEDIIFSRGGLRIRDVSERLITGKEKTDSTKEIKSEEVSDVKKIKPSSILSGTKNKYNRAKELVQEFWKKNEGTKKLESFKGLKSVIDDVIVEVFDITASALSARSGNLNRSSMNNALKNITKPLNVIEIRNADDSIETARVDQEETSDFIDDLNRRKLLEKNDPEYIEGYTRSKEPTSILDLLTKFFPESTVPEYFYANGERGRAFNTATGIGDRLKEAFYVNRGRSGKTSGNTQRDLSDVTFDEMLEVIGAYKDTDGVFRFKAGVSGRSPEGLRLLELVKLTGKYITNELSRTETNLDPMTKADIAAGKSSVMFSLKIERALEAVDVDVDLNLSPENIKNTRLLYKDIANELGAQNTVDYLVPLISRGYGTFITVNNKKLLVPGRYSVFKNREDFFSIIDMDSFKDFKSGDRKVTIDDKDVDLKINFDQNAKNVNKIIDTITDRQDFAKDQQKGLLKIIKILRKKLKEDFEGNKNAVGTIVQTMNSNVDGLIRTAAVPKYMFLETNTTDYVYEHSKTASDTLVEISQLIFSKDNPDVDNDFKSIMEDFVVSIIPKSYDKILNTVSRQNGGRVGGTRSNYALPLIKPDSDGIPARYKMQEFTKKVLKKGWVPMDLVLISKENAKLHLDGVKDNKKVIESNEDMLPSNLKQKDQTNNSVMESMKNFDKAITIANSLNQETKGISVWDFDDTLARSKSNVLYTMPDGSKGKLTAEQFAKDGDRLMAEGAKFDFSEFSKVVNGSKGPFFEKAMARNKKFGNKNVFILTARPANSATAIHEFLKGIGLDIPLANITGLANSSPQAKANWVVGKASEGYNDFYFADDHIGNVKAVEQALSVLDVKSKVQQARISSSLDMSKEFNKYLEGSTGIDSFKNYKSDKARLKGRFKGKFDVFIPPSAEDFLGLLYKTINKGKQGEAQLKFYEDNLLKPYAKANSALRSARVRSIKEFNAIKKKLKIVPKDLKRSFKVEDENGNIKDSLFTKEQAIRVYIWNSQGIEMPNLSQADLAIMVNEVNANPELKAFADELLKLNRGMDSKPPSKNWMDGNIGIDLQANLNSVGRKKLLEVWQQNVDAIFSEVNLNKLEVAYGPEYVKALESSLRRMRTGRSAAPVTDNEAGNNLIMWLNSAVGNIMFFNNRSALLQMLSATNFLNFEDNNIIAAGKAFMNPKQYWKDFTMLMNSDYLLDRRDGTRININEADIALIAKQSGFTGVIAKILELGFLPTKFADSLAIATGGATFYRTKVNALVKRGMSKAKAEAQAMQEFVSVAETSQQSSDQSKISMEQSGSVGKIILAFNNTSSQYSRIIKRSVQDLYNRRGSDKANLAKIVYYGGMQNLLFNFMQQAMFAAMWGGEDDEEVLDDKKAKIVNSMADGLLRGMGVKAAIFVAVKNAALKLLERNEKKRGQNLKYYAVTGMTALSPPLSSKASKLARAADAFQYGKDEMKYGKLSLDSPELTIGANLVSFVFSLPTDRLLTKAINVSDALDASNEPWERLFMIMGWPKWTLSTKAESDLERKEDKTEIKEAKEKAEFDAMTPLEQKVKALENLKKFQQVDSLKAYGLTDKQIRLLTREEDRINKILSLEGSEKKGLTPADKAEEELYDLKKKQQVDSLTKYGLTKKQIRNLKYEEDRVKEILRLRKKKKRENSLK
jgi:hypothetical protein